MQEKDRDAFIADSEDMKYESVMRKRVDKRHDAIGAARVDTMLRSASRKTKAKEKAKTREIRAKAKAKENEIDRKVRQRNLEDQDESVSGKCMLSSKLRRKRSWWSAVMSMSGSLP